MASDADKVLVDAVRAAAYPLTSAAADYDVLLDAIGEAQFVLIGAASHGTHDFYEARAEVTKRLIQEKGFQAVAVEADWPDAYRINRYVKGLADGGTAVDALSGFKRFPTWMWRNAVVLDFVGWLRAYNDDRRGGAAKAGFYGLDLYSMYQSIEAVLQYLDKVDPEAARRARYRYACFEHFGEDSQAYSYAASFDLGESCEAEAVGQLVELQRKAGELAQRDGRLAEDEYFFVQQNARLVKSAEEYYRAMFHSHIGSWNLRDTHMAETLGHLAEHVSQQGQPAKIVVWEHNTHLGDARATEMGERGELNVGQLVRERYGERVCNVGFTTNTGTVTAASNWDAPAERKRVRPGLPGSYEALLHATGLPQCLLDLQAGGEATDGLRERRLERAIGVIYRPETERISHYFDAVLPEQFNFVVHIDETRALEPLERTAQWRTGEVEETYPSAL